MRGKQVACTGLTTYNDRPSCESVAKLATIAAYMESFVAKLATNKQLGRNNDWLYDPMYLTRKKKLGSSEHLDRLCKACGAIWQDTATWYWRFLRRQGHPLPKHAMTRLMCSRTMGPKRASNPLADKPSRRAVPSCVAQNVVRSYYAAIKSWQDQIGSGANPPGRAKTYYRSIWNADLISIKNKGNTRHLRLSGGRGNAPLLFKWPHPDKPKTVEIGWDGDQHELRAQYEVEADRTPEGDKVAGIDLGEVHLAAATDGENTWIVNGRHLRSLRRQQNKTKARLDAQLDHKQPGSRRHRKLSEAKKEQMAKIRNQIRDVIHKQSTRLVETLYEAGVAMLVIGDVRKIRARIDYGRRANQKLHQWAHGRFRHMLTYKAELSGMEVKLICEAYTSQTCPSCGRRHKSQSRNFKCPSCGAVYHRDEVGARNIREKYLDEEGWSEGYLPRPVAAGRAPATSSEDASLETCSSPIRGRQLKLFDSHRGASFSERRETSHKRRVTPPPMGIRYRPHMSCKK